MKDKIKVLYIAGPGRTGTTLLERILGNIDGFFSAGELTFIWERGLKNNQLCGCKVPFRECNFWKAIFKQAFGDTEELDVEYLVRLNHFLCNPRLLPLHLMPKKPYFFQNRLKNYEGYLRNLYSAVSKLTGCRVIVDSSKQLHGLILQDMPSIELYIVHFLRDSRACAFSWSRSKVYEQQEGRVIYMPQFNPAVASYKWALDNLTAEALRYKTHDPSKYMLLRYEDFVGEPSRFIRQIIQMLGESVSELPFIDARRVMMGDNHTVSGNPLRFQKGVIAIKIDDEWKASMRSSTKKMIAILTGFLLKRYGYL